MLQYILLELNRFSKVIHLLLHHNFFQSIDIQGFLLFLQDKLKMFSKKIVLFLNLNSTTFVLNEPIQNCLRWGSSQNIDLRLMFREIQVWTNFLYSINSFHGDINSRYFIIHGPTENFFCRKSSCC